MIRWDREDSVYNYASSRLTPFSLARFAAHAPAKSKDMLHTNGVLPA